MTAIPALPSLAPTQDERTMATLAQALSILGFLAPLIIFLIKRQSRFVSFHALQAVLWHAIYFAAILVAVFGFIFVMFFSIAHTVATKGNEPPLAMFAFIPVLWLLIAAGSIINLVLAIVYAIKAGQGEWAEYPVIGRWARRMLKIGPGGAPI